MNIKKTLILLSFILAGKAVPAQQLRHMLGLQGSGFAREGVIKKISPAAGIFYDYSFNTRFGVGVAAIYRKRFEEGFCNNCYEQEYSDQPMVKFRFNYLEIPVNFRLNLNRAEAKGWRTDLLFGGTYSYFMHTVIRDIHTGERLFKFKRQRNLGDRYYANFGFELKPKVGAKYQLGFNPGLRISLSDQFSESYIYLQLRLGRKF